MQHRASVVPRPRASWRLATVALCALGAVALLPIVALATPVTTPAPSLPATAANFQVVTLSATATANPGMACTISYRIAAGPWTTYSTLYGNVPVIASYSTHTLSYYATDASCTEAANIGTVTVTDSLAPLTTLCKRQRPTFDKAAAFTLLTSDNTYAYSAGYGVTVVGSGVAGTWYKFDSAPWTSFTPGTDITSTVYGVHTLLFYSTDNVGNKEATETTTFEVKDNTPPTSTSDAVATYAGSATIHLAAADDTGGSGWRTSTTRSTAPTATHGRSTAARSS